VKPSLKGLYGYQPEKYIDYRMRVRCAHPEDDFMNCPRRSEGDSELKLNSRGVKYKERWRYRLAQLKPGY
jgi:hypothetical protein